jgi:hypothetical protein
VATGAAAGAAVGLGATEGAAVAVGVGVFVGDGVADPATTVDVVGGIDGEVLPPPHAARTVTASVAAAGTILRWWSTSDVLCNEVCRDSTVAV